MKSQLDDKLCFWVFYILCFLNLFLSCHFIKCYLESSFYHDGLADKSGMLKYNFDHGVVQLVYLLRPVSNQIEKVLHAICVS